MKQSFRGGVNIIHRICIILFISAYLSNRENTLHVLYLSSSYSIIVIITVIFIMIHRKSYFQDESSFHTFICFTIQLKEFIHFWCLSHWLGIIIELRVNYEVINQSRNNPPQLIISTGSSFEKLERTTYHNYSRSSNNLFNQVIEKLNLLFARTQLRSSVGIATEQATASALIRITQSETQC